MGPGVDAIPAGVGQGARALSLLQPLDRLGSCREERTWSGLVQGPLLKARSAESARVQPCGTPSQGSAQPCHHSDDAEV